MAVENTKRNKTIYEKKYGLNGHTQKTYDQLAVEYKLHSQRVVQIVRNYRIKYGPKQGA